MWVSKITRLSSSENFGKTKINIQIDGKPAICKELNKNDAYEVYLKEEVISWRRAYCIHQWFVKCFEINPETCVYVPLTIKDLESLYNTCVTVNNRMKSKKALPRNLSAIDWNEIDVEQTINMLKPVIESHDSSVYDVFYEYGFG